MKRFEYDRIAAPGLSKGAVGTADRISIYYILRRTGSERLVKKGLLALLVTVTAAALLPLMHRHLMALSFFTAGHAVLLG